MSSPPVPEPPTGLTLTPADLARLVPSADGVAVTDAQGRVLAASARAAALVGRSPEGLAGTLLTDLVASPEAPPGAIPLEVLRQSRGPSTVAVRRADGSVLDVELSALALAEGRHLWILRDLTDRRQVEAALWIRFQAIESSINAIAFAGLDGRLSYVNASFLRMWGYHSIREVVGMPATSFWDAPEQAVAVLDQVATKGHWLGELTGRRRTGERFVAELSATMVHDAAGAPVALMGSFIDVTERNRAIEALRQGEERLRQAVRVAHIGIFDHDHLTDTIHWSPEQRENYGFSPDEPVTLPKFLACVHPDDLQPVGEAVQRAHAPSGDGLFDVEHRIIRRDGDIRWLTTQSQTFFEGEGPARRPVRTVGAVLDVTERKRADEERDLLQAQLSQAQKMESIGQLAGGVAHDFNNMLAVILGTTELIRQRVQDDAILAADLADIERAAEHARDVTRQLLAFSRKQVRVPQPLALNDHLARTRKTMARLIGEDVTLEFHAGPGLWMVRMDPSQVDQILMNLSVNAHDAMPRGGRLIVETANASVDEAFCRQNAGFRPGDYVLLAVSDSGVGMDPQTRGRIFEPFFTTKALGQGTGLGLATVYGIVAQNGGMIHVSSEPGQGSTFKVYFPRLLEGGAAAPRPEEAVPLLHGTVLLVEDEEMVRRVTSEMLQALGLTVLAAATWREALAFVTPADRRIDVLVTDVVMPEMSGKALRDRIWQLRPDLPVVFMSGHTPDVIVHHGELEEGVQLLQKPFSTGDLARALRGALRP